MGKATRGVIRWSRLLSPISVALALGGALRGRMKRSKAACQDVASESLRRPGEVRAPLQGSFRAFCAVSELALHSLGEGGAIGHWLLAIGYWLLAIGYWLSAIGYRLSAIGYRLLAIGYWSFATRCAVPKIEPHSLRRTPHCRFRSATKRSIGKHYPRVSLLTPPAH